MWLYDTGGRLGHLVDGGAPLRARRAIGVSAWASHREDRAVGPVQLSWSLCCRPPCYRVLGTGGASTLSGDRPRSAAYPCPAVMSFGVLYEFPRFCATPPVSPGVCCDERTPVNSALKRAFTLAGRRLHIPVTERHREDLHLLGHRLHADRGKESDGVATSGANDQPPDRPPVRQHVTVRHPGVGLRPRPVAAYSPRSRSRHRAPPSCRCVRPSPPERPPPCGQ